MNKALYISVTNPCTGSPAADEDGVVTADVYDLETLDLSDFRGIYLAGWVDQVFLSTQREKLTRFVANGGRMFFNGHPVLQFLDPMPSHRALDFHGAGDLLVSRVSNHPIWDGVDTRDFDYRTGVEGNHSYQELEKIGVAGFYSRSYLADLPAGSTVICGIGPARLPIDVAYPIGSGQVVIHCGLEIVIFDYPEKSTAGLRKRLFSWLKGQD